MLDWRESQTGSVQRPPGVKALGGVFRSGSQAPFVEDFRRKITNVRVESPGLLQEQALIVADRWLPAKQMGECGNVSARGVNSRLGLIQLQWISKQHQTARRLRNGQNVSQRHLA